MGSRTVTTCDRCGEDVPGAPQDTRPMFLVTLRPDSELDEAVDRSELKDLCADCEKVVGDMLRNIFVAKPDPRKYKAAHAAKKVLEAEVTFTKEQMAYINRHGSPPPVDTSARGAARVVLTVFGPDGARWSQMWHGAGASLDGNRVILCPNADDTDGAMAIVWGPWIAFKERRGTVGKVDIDWSAVEPPFVPSGTAEFMALEPGETVRVGPEPRSGSDESDLVERAVRNAKMPGSPRWAAVKRVFAVGSTRAHALCVRFGLDPDEAPPQGVCTCNDWDSDCPQHGGP